MHLINWHYELIDFGNPKNEFDYVEDLSIIANSVDFCNELLSKDVKSGDKVLEVGCGTQSVLRDKLKNGSRWEGIDVTAFDQHGIPTIATKVASVGSIPFENGYFDYVLSNQSIEHWHEYGISPYEGLSEIRRVLKNGGKAILNFPIHLHGHRDFVRGNFDNIDENFVKAGLRIVTKTAFVDSRQEPYKAWRKCGFPDFYISRSNYSEETSYCVEYTCLADNNGFTSHVKKSEVIEVPPRLSSIARVYHHGLIFLLWKLMRRLIKSS